MDDQQFAARRRHMVMAIAAHTVLARDEVSKPASIGACWRSYDHVSISILSVYEKSRYCGCESKNETSSFGRI